MKLKSLTEKLKHPFFIVSLAAFALLMIGFVIGRYTAPTVLPLELPQAPAAEAAEQPTPPDDLPASEPTAQRKLMDLNTATLEQLLIVPGIGEKTAELILAYREEHGGFTSVEQLLEIKGIGEKKLETMREYLTVQ